MKRILSLLLALLIAAAAFPALSCAASEVTQKIDLPTPPSFSVGDSMRDYRYNVLRSDDYSNKYKSVLNSIYGQYISPAVYVATGNPDEPYAEWSCGSFEPEMDYYIGFALKLSAEYSFPADEAAAKKLVTMGGRAADDYQYGGSVDKCDYAFYYFRISTPANGKTAKKAIDITGFPEYITAGQTERFYPNALPLDSTHSHIAYTIIEGKSLISDYNMDAQGSRQFNITAEAPGKIKIRAKVINGLGGGNDYTKDFTVTVLEENTNSPVTGATLTLGSTPQYGDLTHNTKVEVDNGTLLTVKNVSVLRNGAAAGGAEVYTTGNNYTLSVELWVNDGKYKCFDKNLLDENRFYLDEEPAIECTFVSSSTIRLEFELDVEPAKVKSVDLTFNPPRDCQQAPNGSDEYSLGIYKLSSSSAEKVTLSSSIVVQGNKVITGELNSREEYTFQVTVKTKPGYLFDQDFSVKVNGEKAVVTKKSNMEYIVSTPGPVVVQRSSGVKIEYDLPEVIEFNEENPPLAEIYVSHSGDIQYKWIIHSQTGEKVLDETVYKFVLNGLTKYDDGKYLECVILAGDTGGTRSRLAQLKYVGAESKDHVHKYEMKHDGQYHWEECLCGDTRNKAEHTYSEWIVVTPATETQDGLQTRSCTVCGSSMEMPVPKGSAHVHTFTPGYDDEQHWEKCSCGEVKLIEDHNIDVKHDADGHWEECECGYKTEKEEHEFGEWKVTKKATEKTAGSKERECELCEYKEVEAIPVTALTTPFVDVPKDAYYYDATVWAFNAKPQITDGNGKDKFMPEQTCSRGQVVTFLWRSAGCPEPKTKSNPFVDVKPDDYFYKPVLWAVEKGITDGTDPTHFSPGNPCRNSHILTFIYRAMGEPNKTGEGTWYTDAYNWANFNGLLKGTYIGTFDINADCPRKNVVQYLYKYYTMQ